MKFAPPAAWQRSKLATSTPCVLQPELTPGPYLVTSEQVRRDVTNGKQGVPLTLEVRVLNTSTCKPRPDIHLDLWQANATGVYSGLQHDTNGNPQDASNVHNTAFRGIQVIDSSGIVTFDTKFPGHYTGRASHIHILTHNPNSAWLDYYTDTSTHHEYFATHNGQVFFDQNLISEVEALEPYSSNQQQLLLNVDDQTLQTEADSSDPFVKYALIGSTLEDGILAWMTVGIDTSNNIVVDTPYDLDNLQR